MTLEQIEAWLANKGTTLWGIWNINDPVQRRQAAEWFAQQVNDCTASGLAGEYNHSLLWGDTEPQPYPHA